MCRGVSAAGVRVQAKQYANINACQSSLTVNIIGVNAARRG